MTGQECKTQTILLNFGSPSRTVDLRRSLLQGRGICSPPRPVSCGVDGETEDQTRAGFLVQPRRGVEGSQTLQHLGAFAIFWLRDKEIEAQRGVGTCYHGLGNSQVEISWRSFRMRQAPTLR